LETWSPAGDVSLGGSGSFFFNIGYIHCTRAIHCNNFE
jgi:hypothetical protein